jgi:hypothetical protein
MGMAAQGVCTLAALNIPQPDSTVVTATCQHPACSGKPQDMHLFIVFVELVARVESVALGCVPDANHAIDIATCQQLTVGRKGKGRDSRRMRLKCLYKPACTHIPQVDCPIAATAGYPLFIRAKGKRPRRADMFWKCV